MIMNGVMTAYGRCLYGSWTFC